MAAKQKNPKAPNPADPDPTVQPQGDIGAPSGTGVPPVSPTEQPPDAPPPDSEAPSGTGVPPVSQPPTEPTLLQDITLHQHGKPVDGEPVSDNYAVRQAPGRPPVANPSELIRELSRVYPRCVFTWFAE